MGTPRCSLYICTESLLLGFDREKVHHLRITHESTPLRLIVRVVKGGSDEKEASEVDCVRGDRRCFRGNTARFGVWPRQAPRPVIRGVSYSVVVTPLEPRVLSDPER
jgi:hypothetical protein